MAKERLQKLLSEIKVIFKKNKIAIIYTSIFILLNIPYYSIMNLTFLQVSINLFFSSICLFFLFLSLEQISSVVLLLFFNIFFIFSLGALYFFIFQKTELQATLIMDLIKSDWKEIYIYLKPILFEVIVAVFLLLVSNWAILYKTVRRKFQFSDFYTTPAYFLIGVLPVLLTFIRYIVLPYPYNFISLSYQAYKLNSVKHPFISRSKEVLLEKSKIHPIVVFHIGEAVRADHLSINGYKRDTTPLLKKMNIINLGIAKSYRSSTFISIPFINTSHQANFNLIPALKEKSISDIFQNHGFFTHFIGREEIYPLYFYLDKATQDKVLTNDFHYDIHEAFKDYIHQHNMLSSGRHFFIIRNRGSHYDYISYYKPKFTKYKPVCTQVANNCKITDLVNVYDNTIYYLDYTIREIIKELKALHKPVLYFYSADHGESLGERGYFGHMNAAIESRMMPMFLWISDEYKKEYPFKYKTLIENATRYKDRLTYDIIWHSLLDGSGFKNKNGKNPINKELSLFSEKLKPQLSKGWFKTDYQKN